MGPMLSLYFSGEGYSVHHVITVQEGILELETWHPDVVLLDLMLPDSVGVDTCITLRKHTEVPILVISMQTDLTDRIHALSSGSDDYICKPFSMQELKARIEAVLRRTTASHALSSTHPVPAAASVASPIQLDHERRMLLVNSIPVETTYSEWELLKLFACNPGKVFDREELINAVRGIDKLVNDRAIDVHIMNLRKKIEPNPKQPIHIKTVWGVGYKYSP